MRALVLGLLASCAASSSFAATSFTASTYLSEANIPVGLYGPNGPHFLETFEDGTLDGGITYTVGSNVTTNGVFGPGEFRDSVDGDDGAIDGSGTGGHAFFISKGSTNNGVQGGVLFTFPGLVTAAGVVFTDGSGVARLVAYDANGNAILFGGSSFVQGSNLDPGSFKGETAEDNFIGVSYAAGIRAIRATSGVSHGLELDHLQYGSFVAPVPLPASLAFLATALVGLVGMRRRRAA